MKLKPLVWANVYNDIERASFCGSCYEAWTMPSTGKVVVGYHADHDTGCYVSKDAGSMDNAKALAQEHAQTLFDTWVEQYVDFSKPPLEWRERWGWNWVAKDPENLDSYYEILHHNDNFGVNTPENYGKYVASYSGWCGGDMVGFDIGEPMDTLEEAKTAIEQHRTKR